MYCIKLTTPTCVACKCVLLIYDRSYKRTRFCAYCSALLFYDLLRGVSWVHVSLSNHVEIVNSVNYVHDCFVILCIVLYVLPGLFQGMRVMLYTWQFDFCGLIELMCSCQ